MLRFGTLVLAVCAAWTSPLASERQVLTFRTRAWLSFAPPTCRMPLGQASGFSRANPGGRGTPRFRHRLIGFRHVIDGSLALASLNLACRDQVPTFPQRSPPSLLTTAACGGLRPAPDCRPRRALLHLSYSSAPSYSDGAFVTHAPQPTFGSVTSVGFHPLSSEIFLDRLSKYPPTLVAHTSITSRDYGCRTRNHIYVQPISPGPQRCDRARLCAIASAGVVGDYPRTGRPGRPVLQCAQPEPRPQGLERGIPRVCHSEACDFSRRPAQTSSTPDTRSCVSPLPTRPPPT